MINVYKRGNTQNYVYIDSATDGVVALYGEQVISPNLDNYTLIGPAPVMDTKADLDIDNDIKFDLYVAALQAGHSIDVSRIISGYEGE